jgi:predicted enzyme related to lactoylglutathione lyase
VNGDEIAVFPHDGQQGVGGCVTTMAAMRPSETGSLVYLHVGQDLDVALERSRSAGAQIVVGKTAVPGGLGHYAHIIDSEGNRVGLHAV